MFSFIFTHISSLFICLVLNQQKMSTARTVYVVAITHICIGYCVCYNTVCAVQLQEQSKLIVSSHSRFLFCYFLFFNYICTDRCVHTARKHRIRILKNAYGACYDARVVALDKVYLLLFRKLMVFTF